MQKGAVAQAKALKCKLIVLDDALSVDKQVSNMEQLLAQNADVIIFYPLDPKATTPVLAGEGALPGAPVLAVDASFGNTKAVPLDQRRRSGRAATSRPISRRRRWRGRRREPSSD